MDDNFVSDPAETQHLQHKQQQEALQPSSQSTPGPINFPTQQDDIHPDSSNANSLCTAAQQHECSAEGLPLDGLTAAAAAAAGSAAAPATDVLISCQGLEALLFLDPAFPRGLARPSWLVRCLCTGCQQQAGPDG
jgi:hypothetical protein